MLTALSRGATGVWTCLRMLGRFAGGAGGAGLAFAAAVPLARAAPAPLDVGVGAGAGARTATGGGGGGGGGAASLISSMYASGVQPWTPVLGFMHSHQPRY